MTRLRPAILSGGRSSLWTEESHSQHTVLREQVSVHFCIPCQLKVYCIRRMTATDNRTSRHITLQLLALVCSLGLGIALSGGHSDAQSDDSYVFSIAWSPDGSHFAAGYHDGTIRVWETSTDQPPDIFTVTSPADNSLTLTELAWSADSRKIAFAATSWRSYGIIGVLNAADGALLASFDAGTEADAVAWSPDGSRLAGTESIGHPPNAVGWLKVWDSGTWVELINRDDHGGAVEAVDWSPDGSRLASGGADGMIIVWDATTWNWFYYLSADVDADGVYKLAWSPDSSKLAAPSGKSSVQIWEAASGELLTTLSCGNSSLHDFAWEPSGVQLAGACSHNIRLWEVRSGTFSDLSPTTEILNRLAWSPLGDRLLYSSRNLSSPRWLIITGEAGEQSAAVLPHLWPNEPDQSDLVGPRQRSNRPAAH
jgi:WD40 repeat protein